MSSAVLVCVFRERNSRRIGGLSAEMRKILSLSAFVLFLAVVAFFQHFGEELRDIYSPAVVCEKIEYRKFDEADDHAYPSFSKEAIWEDELGKYVWMIDISKDFSEEAYIVRRFDVTAVHEDESFVYVKNSPQNHIVISHSGTLTDGCRVKITETN